MDKQSRSCVGIFAHTYQYCIPVRQHQQLLRLLHTLENYHYSQSQARLRLLQRAIRVRLVTPTLWFAEAFHRSGSLPQKIPRHHPLRWPVCVHSGQPTVQRQLLILPEATYASINKGWGNGLWRWYEENTEQYDRKYNVPCLERSNMLISCFLYYIINVQITGRCYIQSVVQGKMYTNDGSSSGLWPPLWGKSTEARIKTEVDHGEDGLHPLLLQGSTSPTLSIHHGCVHEINERVMSHILRHFPSRFLSNMLRSTGSFHRT